MRQVKSLVRLDGLLTIDRIYTVIHEMKGFLTIIDDRGVSCNYSEVRFEPILAPQVPPDFHQMQQIAADVNITMPNEPTVPLTADPREGDLLIQLNARRESALEDSDANLAALLYRAIETINQLTEASNK